MMGEEKKKKEGKVSWLLNPNSNRSSIVVDDDETLFRRIQAMNHRSFGETKTQSN